MFAQGLRETYSIQGRKGEKERRKKTAWYIENDMVEVSPYITIITINFKGLVLV